MTSGQFTAVCCVKTCLRELTEIPFYLSKLQNLTFTEAKNQINTLTISSVFESIFTLVYILLTYRECTFFCHPAGAFSWVETSYLGSPGRLHSSMGSSYLITCGVWTLWFFLLLKLEESHPFRGHDPLVSEKEVPTKNVDIFVQKIQRNKNKWFHLAF